MSAVFVVTIVFLTVLVLPICGSASASIDVFGNVGDVCVRVFGIPVFCGEMHLESRDIIHNNLVIQNRAKRKYEVHLSADRNDQQSIVSIITSPLFGNINITDIQVSADIGKSDDAIFATMSILGLKLVYSAVVAVIKSQQQLRSVQRFRAVYDRNIFHVELSGIFVMTIADIIYGAILQARHSRSQRGGTHK